MWYGGILGIGESVATFGIGTWVLFGVPYYAFALIYAFWLAPRVRYAPQLSIPERVQLRFGTAAAVAAAILLFLLAVPAAHVLMLGTLVRALSGWDLWICVLLGTLVGATFLVKGGLLADARVSLLAFLMMYLGFGAMAVWCFTHYSLSSAIDALPPAQRTWDGGTGIIYVLSLFIVGAWTLVDPGFHQRVTSASSERVGRIGVLISTGFWFLFDMLSISTALFALATVKSSESLDLYPQFAQQTLPPGLKAAFFCGMMGTITSAMVGYSLVSGTTIGREIVGRLKPELDDRQVTLWSRIGIAAACAVAIGLALQIQSVVDLWTAWAGAVVGAMLLPVVLAYKRNLRIAIGNGWVLLSMVAAFSVAIGWMIYGRTHGNELLELGVQRGEGGLRLFLPGSNGPIPADASKIAIGTLLPGLLTSALVIALGAAFSRTRATVK